MNQAESSINKEVLNRLSQLLQGGRFPHALILEGGAGQEKTEAALFLARAAVCTGEPKPCGRCPGCRKALASSHPDIYVAGGGTAARSFHVEAIRFIRSDAYIKPNEAPRKVYVLLEAQTMSEQAQNALLKTIEEPPAYGVILLLAESVQSFLPTVRSRCVLLRLLPLPEEKVRKILTGRYGVEESTARACAALCGGSVGQALRLARSEDFIRLRERWMEWLSGLARQETWEVLARAKALEEDKAVIEDVLRMMQIWFRDLIILRETGSLSGCVCRDLDAKLESSANLYEIPELYRKIEVLEDAKKKLSHNVNYGLWSDWLLVELSRRKTFHQ